MIFLGACKWYNINLSYSKNLLEKSLPLLTWEWFNDTYCIKKNMHQIGFKSALSNLNWCGRFQDWYNIIGIYILKIIWWSWTYNIDSTRLCTAFIKVKLSKYCAPTPIIVPLVQACNALRCRWQGTQINIQPLYHLTHLACWFSPHYVWGTVS